MADDELQIGSEETSKASVVKLSGSVDIDRSPRVRNALRALWRKKVPAIVVNLEEVDHIDTSGLATFIECAQELKKHEGRLLLCGPNKRVRGRIALAQLESYFVVFETQADALAALGEETPEREE